MKVPPKRKGNFACGLLSRHSLALNESPSEKEGKFPLKRLRRDRMRALNESPSEKEGK